MSLHAGDVQVNVYIPPLCGVQMCVYVYACVRSLFVCLCVLVCLCVFCVYCVFFCVCVCVFVCVYVCVCVCMCVCVGGGGLMTSLEVCLCVCIYICRFLDSDKSTRLDVDEVL